MKKKSYLPFEKNNLPASIWALAVSVFAIGTTEVVMIGLLPTIAREFSTSISMTGWLVTSYAIGVAIGGPILTAITGKTDRKKLLLAILLLFVISNILASVSFIFFMLILGRVFSGVAHGVFVGIGTNIASSLVRRELRATAIAIMFTGLTVAMVTGVPLGTYIGQHFGWRFTFGGIGVIGLLCIFANYVWLPGNLKGGNTISFRDQLGVLRNKSLMMGFSLTLFSFAGLFGTFTYLSPLLENVSGFTTGQITLILLLYGLAVAFGNIIGGKFGNSNPARVLFILFIANTLTFLSMYVMLFYKIPTLILVSFMGFSGFATVPGMQLYIIQLSEKHLKGTEDVSSVLNISAFNIGIALGSSIGAMLISISLVSITLMSAGFSIVAILMCYISLKREKNNWNLKSIKWNTEI